MLCGGIQEPTVVGNPIDYQVCLLDSHLGQITLCTNSKELCNGDPVCALRCWADIL